MGTVSSLDIGLLEHQKAFYSSFSLSLQFSLSEVVSSGNQDCNYLSYIPRYPCSLDGKSRPVACYQPTHVIYQPAMSITN